MVKRLVVQSTALSDSHPQSAFSKLPHLAHLLFQFVIFFTSEACTATEVFYKVGESFARGEERTVIASKTLRHSVLSFLSFAVQIWGGWGVYKKKCVSNGL